MPLSIKSLQARSRAFYTVNSLYRCSIRAALAHIDCSPSPKTDNSDLDALFGAPIHSPVQSVVMVCRNTAPSLAQTLFALACPTVRPSDTFGTYDQILDARKR